MSLKSKVGSNGNESLDGLFKLKLTSVYSKEESYGEILIFVFTIAEGDHTGRIVKGICTNYDPIPPKSKLFLWARALLGRSLKKGEEIDWESMVGNECIGKVVPKETASGVFEKVQRLYTERVVR